MLFVLSVLAIMTNTALLAVTSAEIKLLFNNNSVVFQVAVIAILEVCRWCKCELHGTHALRGVSVAYFPVPEICAVDVHSRRASVRPPPLVPIAVAASSCGPYSPFGGQMGAATHPRGENRDGERCPPIQAGGAGPDALHRQGLQELLGALVAYHLPSSLVCVADRSVWRVWCVGGH